MIFIVLGILSGAHGLRLTNQEPDAAHVQATYMSIGINEPLQNLKRSNDILDKYIANYAERHELPYELFKGETISKNLSIIESDGFVDESDELWTKRKQRHINQMSMENILMTTCPDGFWSGAKQCLEGCVGKKANCAGKVFWQTHYEPSFSCLLEERIGYQGEGGKWVCDPSKIRAQETCLVYSIGSHGQYDFEEAVHNSISSKCEIHTVDMKPWNEYTKHAPPEYVTYHVNKIGPAPDTPIDALVTTLGHTGREIDIFKIDCEGCEWATYKSWFGGGVHIRQILVKIHGTGSGHGAHKFFNTLFNMGYVVFHKEPNSLCDFNCIEYAFVKLNPKFSRAENATLS